MDDGACNGFPMIFTSAAGIFLGRPRGRGACEAIDACGSACDCDCDCNCDCDIGGDIWEALTVAVAAVDWGGGAVTVACCAAVAVLGADAEVLRAGDGAGLTTTAGWAGDCVGTG